MSLWFGPVAALTTCYGGGVDRRSAMWAFRYVQQVANSHAAMVIDAWWALADRLVW
eukprot:gene11776-40022_t